jgi:hypothetical protein
VQFKVNVFANDGPVQRLIMSRMRSITLTLPILMVCQLLRAQVTVSPVTPQLPSECAASSLDTNFHFANEPSTETVLVTMSNISDRPCMLQSGQGVMFGDYRHGHNIWTKDCRNCDTAGKPRIVAPLQLAPGKVAGLRVVWQTKAAPGGELCQEGGEMNGSSWSIWADTLLRDVCSVVHVESYFPVPDETRSDVDHNSAVKISLSSSGNTNYWLDSFWLDITILDPNALLKLGENSCPPLLSRMRSSEGTTTLQKVSGYCTVRPLSQASGRSINLNLSIMGWGALGTPGMHTVQLLTPRDSASAESVVMIGSNTLNVHTVDPVTMPRKWGPQAKGLAISLFLDKAVYPVGEDIPLRMALKNFSSAAPVASGELPCFAGLIFRVHDAAGTERESHEMMCSGHGWLIGYPEGVMVPVGGVTLKNLGLLPDRPGKYTLEVTWPAQMEKDAKPENEPKPHSLFGATLIPYATVNSDPVQFEVVTTPESK